MRPFLTAIAASVLVAGAALAQTAAPSGQMNNTGRADTTTGSSNNAVNPSNRTGPDAARTGSITSPTLEEGSNSFTEAQARSRMEEAGFQQVMGLEKDDKGIWRGKAMQNGRQVTVGLDYKGNVAAQ